MAHRDLEPLDVMQAFLLDVIEQVPDEMTGQVRTMQTTLVSLRHELETLERMERRAENARKRIGQLIEYFQMALLAISDSVTKVSVVEPLAKRLRQLLSQMRDIDLFGDLNGEQIENDGTVADRDGTD